MNQNLVFSVELTETVKIEIQNPVQSAYHLELK